MSKLDNLTDSLSIDYALSTLQLEGVPVTIVDDEMEGFSMEEALLDNLLNFAGTPKVLVCSVQVRQMYYVHE